LLVDRKDAAQSDVRIGVVGLDRKDKRYAQFEVFRTAFGDGFTSRLTQRLREQLGIVYNAGAVADWRLAPGPFFVSTAIQTPSTGQGIGEVIKILDDIATKGLPAEELDKAKQNIIRAMPAMFDTNTGTAAAFADLALQGLPDSWYATYAASVRTVTGAQVKAIAKTAMPSGKVVVSIVGDLAKIKADLDKLSLGEAAMHDLYGQPLAK
jgi:predicted Zn-dependent peptidase